jgi:transmembrane sensor
MARVELGDGIHADLDAGSAMKVPRQPWDHSVTLIRGEAMFDVRHDDNRVFVVRAGNATVTDLGTRFLVRHTAQGIGVAVFEGEVEMAAPGTPPGRVVARQAAELTAEGALRALPAPDEASETAWRQGRVVFHDHTLSEVAERLSRYSPHPITIGDAAIAGLRVSGTFGVNNSQDAVRALEQVLPIRAVQRPDVTILEPAAPSRQAPRLIR